MTDMPPTFPGRPAQGALDADTFGEVLAFVLPRREELSWASIPWQTDLWAARKVAAGQDKPIFFWAMNGNPLGCV